MKCVILLLFYHYYVITIPFLLCTKPFQLCYFYNKRRSNIIAITVIQYNHNYLLTVNMDNSVFMDTNFAFY